MPGREGMRKRRERLREEAATHPTPTTVGVLSHHQQLVIAAIAPGPVRVPAIALAVGLSSRSTIAVLKVLRERGLISPTGIKGQQRQGPAHYTYQLTAAGRGFVGSR